MEESGAMRISVPPGGTSEVLEGAVVRGDRDGYVLGAQAGHHLAVSISSLEGNAAFQIFEPSGEQALPGADEMDDATDWSGELPTSGDYMIIVGPTRGSATYKLRVKVE
jgi:hypothetical protein